jgi:hypothetical protein
MMTRSGAKISERFPGEYSSWAVILETPTRATRFHPLALTGRKDSFVWLTRIYFE